MGKLSEDVIVGVSLKDDRISPKTARQRIKEFHPLLSLYSPSMLCRGLLKIADTCSVSVLCKALSDVNKKLFLYTHRKLQILKS